ncbi:MULTISPECIES: MFS transporter [unclassified Brevundimonas]|uniref:MFS transporter n=1 Tax=unclassified Brevundimonas TaxID=2622653 RepID=UPI000CFB693F|nr:MULTISPECIES: glycoside-pentoside-hexuronide (GPH):cation symporter [unclassified Brevundimonas]PRA36026.1 glycoside transporter [Brevundimonas sp. MYb27]PQZ84517.1 glycoside transporter [Brevundimonas sp. MYb31]PRB17752.1 glycoside transporter [Brevundimonas sp. MYb52]PRB38123.1 glycoside transporter [Brevundimonas sp. MYb46]PRB56095.1 glycoside transporter [Brevundimonas sp. MYb33]
MSKQTPGKLGLGRVIGYGAGDFAFNLSFTFCSLFLLYFYTDVLEIHPGTAGLIIMAALIWEGISDPIIGILANRSRSRWGRYRPFLLFGAVPLGLSVIAMFMPVGLTGAALVAYCFITHLIYRTLFTVVNIPYIALSAQMTRDTNQRGALAATRMLFAIACGVVLAALTLPLSAAFGGGQTGFFILSIVYSVVAAAVLLICFASTREEVVEAEHAPIRFRDMFAAMAVNRPFLLLFAATALGATGYTMAGKAVIYYIKYWVGSEAAVTLALVVGLGAAALAMIPWMLVARRFSKRAVWLAGAMINVVAFGVILAFAPRGGVLLWGALVAIGVGNSAFILTFWSMIPDTVEFGEWRTGTRAEGPLFGLIAFSQKVALGLGTGLIGVLLDVVGYTPNQAQTPETLRGIVLLYGLGPMLLFLGSIAVIWAYPLTGSVHGRIVRVIDWRKSRLSDPRPRGGRVPSSSDQPLG